MRALLAVLLLLSACHGRLKTEVARAEGEDFRRLRSFGVATFEDSRGQGDRISDEIKRALSKRMYGLADTAALDKVLKKYDYKKDGLGAEALMDVKLHARCDAVVFGSMAPDWSGARLVLVETDMGEPILHAVLRPEKGRVFFDADAVAEEAVRVLTSPK